MSQFEDIEDSLDKDVLACEEMDSSESLSDAKDSLLDFFDDNLPSIISLKEQLQEEIEK